MMQTFYKAFALISFVFVAKLEFTTQQYNKYFFVDSSIYRCFKVKQKINP